MPLSTLGKFDNSLKFEPRVGGLGVQEGPVYGNGKWLAIRGDNNIITSTDGVTWTSQTTNLPTILYFHPNSTSSFLQNVKTLRFINNRWVALWARQGSGTFAPNLVIVSSTDGITWTKNTTAWTDQVTTTNGTITLDSSSVSSLTTGLAIATAYDITYANGKYWMVGNSDARSYQYSAKVWSSTNLQTWTTAYSVGQVGYDYQFNCVSSLGNSIVVGGTYCVTQASQVGYPLVVQSTNGGTTWTTPSQTKLPQGLHNSVHNRISSIATNGSMTIAVGSSGLIYSNYDGNGQGIFGQFAQRTSPTTKNLSAVAYVSPGYFIAVGNGVILTTNNGVNWVEKALPANPIPGLLNWNDDNSSSYEIGVNGTHVIARTYSSTNSGDTFDYVNYQIPGQQPFLNYGADPKWANWKTIDFWVYLEESAYTEPQMFSICGNGEDVVDSETGFAVSNWWSIWISHDASSYANPLQNTPQLIVRQQIGDIDTSLSNGTYSNIMSNYRTISGDNNYIGPPNGSPNNGTGPVLEFNKWHHVRVVADNGKGAIFIDGQRSRAWYNTNDIGITLNSDLTSKTPATWANPSNFVIGRTGDGVESTYSRPSAYWIDEFMMDTVALTSPTATSFNVPTQPYFNTLTTSLLLHFDTDYLDDNRAPTVAQALLATALSISSQAVKVTRAIGRLESAFAVTSRAQLTKEGTILVANSSSITATATRVKSAQATFTALSSTLITAERVKDARATLTSQATITVQAQVTRNIEASLVALASTIEVGKRVQQLSARLESQFAITAEATTNQVVYARLNALTSTLTAGSRIQTIQANLVATSTLSASLTTTGVTKQANARLEALASTLAQGQLFLIDPSLVWIVPAENRYYSIQKENRGWVIEKEDRNYTI